MFLRLNTLFLLHEFFQTLQIIRPDNPSMKPSWFPVQNSLQSPLHYISRHRKQLFSVFVLNVTTMATETTTPCNSCNSSGSFAPSTLYISCVDNFGYNRICLPILCSYVFFYYVFSKLHQISAMWQIIAF